MDVEHRIVRKKDDGEVRWVHRRAVHTRDADGEVVRSDGTVQDVTERRSAQEEMRRLAMTDHLTGLSNRSEFNRMFEHHPGSHRATVAGWRCCWSIWIKFAGQRRLRASGRRWVLQRSQTYPAELPAHRCRRRALGRRRIRHPHDQSADRETIGEVLIGSSRESADP